jgi:hypothetical protein
MDQYYKSFCQFEIDCYEILVPHFYPSSRFHDIADFRRHKWRLYWALPYFLFPISKLQTPISNFQFPRSRS